MHVSLYVHLQIGRHIVHSWIGTRRWKACSFNIYIYKRINIIVYNRKKTDNELKVPLSKQAQTSAGRTMNLSK